MSMHANPKAMLKLINTAVNLLGAARNSEYRNLGPYAFVRASSELDVIA